MIYLSLLVEMTLTISIFLEYFGYHYGGLPHELLKLLLPIAYLQWYFFIFKRHQQRSNRQIYWWVVNNNICLVQKSQLILHFFNQMIVLDLVGPLPQPIESNFDVQIKSNVDQDFNFSFNHFCQQKIQFFWWILFQSLYFLLLSQDLAHGFDDINRILAILGQFSRNQYRSTAKKKTIKMVIRHYFCICVKDEERHMAKVNSGCQTVTDGGDEYAHFMSHLIESIIFKLSGEQFHFL